MTTLATVKRRAVEPGHLTSEAERALREANYHLSKIAASLPEGDKDAFLAIETMRNIQMLRKSLGN